MKKEDVYINLQGKSKEELTELYSFLESIGEDIFRNDIEWFLKYSNLDRDYAHLTYRPDYENWGNLKTNNKQEVTIQQLKEILQPMETLEQQLEKAKAEVKRLEEESEESKIKIGDWVVNIKSGTCFKWHLLGVRDVSIYKKITDKELINKLNNLIK